MTKDITQIQKGLGCGNILDLFRNNEHLTRSELSAITGLNRAAVSSKIDLLIRDSWVIDKKEGSSNGGRPAGHLILNSNRNHVIAIDLGATHAVVAITNLLGTIVGFKSSKISISIGPEKILSWAIQESKVLLEQLEIPKESISAIGVGVPGPVEFASGKPVNPPIMPGWNMFPIPDFINKHFDVPVIVDNDVNILARGEHVFTWPKLKEILYVKVSTGIGAGIISGGKIQRGAKGSAGDIGHILVPDYRNQKSQPELVELESIASVTAIADYLKSLGIEITESSEIIDLLHSNNPDARKSLRQAGRDIGGVIASCVNILNPEIVIIGGLLSKAGEYLLAGIRETVYSRSLPLATVNLQIVTASGDEFAGVRGAALLAIDAALSVDKINSFYQKK